MTDNAQQQAQQQALTDEREAEIRGRLAKITPGEWRGCQEGECPCCMVWSIEDDVPVHVPATFDWADTLPPPEQKLGNARLIAHAPSDIADLLAEVARLRQREIELERLIALYKPYAIDHAIRNGNFLRGGAQEGE